MTRGERDLRAQQVAAGALRFVQRSGLRHGQQAERGVGRAGGYLACAAASARCARRAGSSVSPADRSRNAAAAAAAAALRPARASSSSAATPSSGPGAAWARCQARRSGSAAGSVASASAPCSSCLVPTATPTGRRPSAPADAGTAPKRRTPPAPPPSPAPPPGAESRAARRPATPAPRSPDGSAAASCTSRWVCGGSVRQLPGEALLDPADQATLRCGSPNPPASCAGSARGAAPAAPAGSRPSRHDLVPDPDVQRPGQRRRQQYPGVVVGQPATTSSGSPAKCSQGTRAANTRPIGSAASRRAANPSACAEAWSSHCWSSTRQISGRSPAASDSRPSTASPTRNRSGGGPALRPNAVAQRLPLRNRKRVGQLEHRRAQLVQPGEGQLHLRLHARRAQRPGTPRHARQGSQAARSCPHRGRPAPRGTDPRRRAHPRRSGQGRHVR